MNKEILGINDLQFEYLLELLSTKESERLYPREMKDSYYDLFKKSTIDYKTLLEGDEIELLRIEGAILDSFSKLLAKVDDYSKLQEHLYLFKMGITSTAFDVDNQEIKVENDIQKIINAFVHVLKRRTLNDKTREFIISNEMNLNLLVVNEYIIRNFNHKYEYFLFSEESINIGFNELILDFKSFIENYKNKSSFEESNKTIVRQAKVITKMEKMNSTQKDKTNYIPQTMIGSKPRFSVKTTPEVLNKCIEMRDDPRYNDKATKIMQKTANYFSDLRSESYSFETLRDWIKDNKIFYSEFKTKGQTKIVDIMTVDDIRRWFLELANIDSRFKRFI